MHSLKGVSRLLAHMLLAVGAAVLAAMMFLTVLDVALRYIFNRSLSGGYELVEYMMAVLVPFGIVYCAHRREHISVDLIVERFPKRVQAILNLSTGTILNLFFLLVAWQSVEYVWEIYRQRLASAVLDIPAYPFVAAVSLGFLALSLELLVDFLDSLSRLRAR